MSGTPSRPILGLDVCSRAARLATYLVAVSVRSGLLLSVRPKRSEDRAAISGIARDAFPGPGRHVGPPCDIAGRLGKLRPSSALAGGEEDGKWDVLGLNFPTSDITTSGHVCGVIYTFFLFCPSKR